MGFNLDDYEPVASRLARWLEVIRWDAGRENQMERAECGAAFDLKTAKLIAAALNRWIAAHDKAQG